MSHSATITYDRPLVRRALNRYFAKRLGKSFFVLLPVIVVALAFFGIAGLWSLPLTICSIVMLIALGYVGLLYFARLRAAEGFFDKANDPTVTITFADEGVNTDSDLGSAELKWSVFDELLKFSDVWLLVYAKSGYMTLPLDQLTVECRQFIEDKMTDQANHR